MDPDLSRRAGFAMSRRPDLFASPDTRLDFVAAVERATSVEDLPERERELLERAETETR